MSRWLAFGGPLVSFTIRFPKVRLKSKDERLRERAVAHVERTLGLWYGEQDQYRIAARMDVRVATMLNERRGVLDALDGKPRWRGGGGGSGIPRWRWIRRRRLERIVCEQHRIARWWR